MTNMSPEIALKNLNNSASVYKGSREEHHALQQSAETVQRLIEENATLKKDLADLVEENATLKKALPPNSCWVCNLDLEHNCVGVPPGDQPDKWHDGMDCKHDDCDGMMEWTSEDEVDDRFEEEKKAGSDS